MADDTMPFVAVIGGFYNSAPAIRGPAIAMAGELGAALATAGFGLVVYFSNENSLEPYVVSGYIAAPGSRAANSIRVRYPESQRGSVVFAEEATHREVFDPRIIIGQDWEKFFYRSLVEAEDVDAVLLMAGGQSTLIAGHIALARQLPVLAIDAFAGSAQVIWADLARESKSYPSASRLRPPELVAWLRDRYAEYARQRAEARRKEIAYRRVISESYRARWAGAAFVALLALLYVGVAQPPPPAQYPFIMFAALVVSGATGALVRAVVWTSSETAATMSLLLGGVAGLVVGLAYLIPQFVGAPAVLEVTTGTVKGTDKIQFVSASLIAFTAGIGFDTVFTRLRTQAETLPVSAGERR
ncbi:MAG TPA: hypothetical protein VEX86_14825 [Longimicrobium sp.]|nr:hypothetical protein [Longimicrobium sp.]